MVYSKKKPGKIWVTVNIVYCGKPKLVHTRVPDAAYHVGPIQCAHHRPNVAQKHGKTWYTVKQHSKTWLQ